MERRWIEKIREMKNEELLRIIERGQLLTISAAEEILSRFERGDWKVNENHLCAIFEFKSKEKTKKEAVKIKERVARIIVERYLNEKNFLTIILQEDIKVEIKEFAAKRYLESKEVSNYTLRKIIEIIPSLRKDAAKKLLNQNPQEDDLLVIEENVEGPLQIEAFNKHWKIGMSLEDACWLIEFVEPLAEKTWKKLRQEGWIKGLSDEQLGDIFRYTDSLKVKREVYEELLPKVEEKLKRARKTLKMNPRDAQAGDQIFELEELVEKLKKEVKKENEKVELYTASQT